MGFVQHASGTATVGSTVSATFTNPTAGGAADSIIVLVSNAAGAFLTVSGIALTGAAHIETDMRAHRNPRRMRAIRRAMVDLVRRLRSQCPTCARPGFAIMGRISGLPCKWCAGPTHLTRAAIWGCEGCGHREERTVAATAADPAHCEACNP